jgi:hypothetical protein
MVSNAGIRPTGHPLVEIVVVAEGPDAADRWIAERIGPGDLCVTADTPLAVVQRRTLATMRLAQVPSQAAVAVQRGLIVPSTGDDGGSDGPVPSTSGPNPSDTKPSDAPGAIETVTDGVGKLLEGVLGGVGDAVRGSNSGDGGTTNFLGGGSGG